MSEPSLEWVRVIHLRETLKTGKLLVILEWDDIVTAFVLGAGGGHFETVVRAAVREISLQAVVHLGSRPIGLFRGTVGARFVRTVA